MKKSSRLIWVITLIVNVVVSSAEQLGYRPFPVLLVHGFNATPSTFGAYTRKEEVGKEEAKWEWLLSTKMIENFKETSSGVDSVFSTPVERKLPA